VEDLASATGASTVCGSCRPLLAQLAGTADTAAAPVGGRGTLLAICIAAGLAVAGVGALPPLVVGASVEHAPAWHVLFTEPSVRRITGFVVLGLTVASLLLSLRKRIRRLAWGNFGWWRVLHTALGLAGVIGLVAHTGLRLGHNFNRLLMLDFIGLVLLGTCAGAVTALEARLDVLAARRLRTFWTWAHIVMAWPLPVLLTFHVLSAYYF
jgi:nitrite reductase (NADH) large subunit